MAEERKEIEELVASNEGSKPLVEANKSSSNLEMRRYLYERVEKKEEQILKMEASVFQVANYYFVFQGVMLTATVKGSSGGLKCQHYWLPLLLSAIGAVLNFGTLVIIAIKYKAGLDELDDRSLALYVHLYGDKKSGFMLKQHQRKKAWRKGIMALSMLLFLGFVALNLLAARMIPC